MQTPTERFLALDLNDKNIEALRERIREELWQLYTGDRLEATYVTREFHQALEIAKLGSKQRAVLEIIFQEIKDEVEIEIEACGGNDGIRQILDEYHS